MVFDDYFDKIYIISLPNRLERLNRALEQLKTLGLCDNPVIFPAISGEIVGVSPWYNYGAGAWGNMISHIRLIEDFLMERNGDENGKILILEDDVIFSKNAKTQFKTFIDNVPADWGQLYLGGQHTLPPKSYNKNVLVGSSVNRNHAYAISARYAKQIHKHVTNYPDYKGAAHLIDHQFEIAHKREDWPVYCPIRWIAGQGENRSDITGAMLSDKWWDHRGNVDLSALPLFVADSSFDINDYLPYIYVGNFAPIDIGLNKATQNRINKYLAPSWDQRRFPGLICNNLTESGKNHLRMMRRGPVVDLSEKTVEEVRAMVEAH